MSTKPVASDTLYGQAVDRMVGEFRDELVIQLVALIPSVGAYSAAHAVYTIVDMFHVTCRELCAAGLDYDWACRFADRWFGPGRDRWIEDRLY